MIRRQLIPLPVSDLSDRRRPTETPTPKKMNVLSLSLVLRRAARLAGFVSLWTVVFTPSELRAQAGDLGVVTGQIINQATSAPLSGALVVLEGNMTVTALSGPDGRFRLTSVPSGARALIVSYTGLNTARTAVMVPAGS